MEKSGHKGPFFFITRSNESISKSIDHVSIGEHDMGGNFMGETTKNDDMNPIMIVYMI